MKNKFVIVTNQRSGSNMLVSMLNEHPDIKCFGELMRATPRWMKKKGYRGALKVLEKVDPVFKDDSYRFGHPDDFVHAVFETSTESKKLYGFKLHLGQHPEYLFQLLRNPEWKVVLLERENKLAQFSSRKISEVTGQGNAPKGTKVIRATVDFSGREFKKFLNKETKSWNEVKNELGLSERDSFQIFYTQLLAKQPIMEMLAYLGVDSVVSLEPGTEKRNPSDILSRFTNREAAATEIEKMNLTDWGREVFAGRNSG
jgi:LPS sulfotransferase NodH